MDEHKICFISCINNAEDYEECLLYLKQLHIPDGMETEVLSVEHADSMTSGYNSAMHASDAKYKIYLHQDVFITNKNYLNNVLDLFQRHPEIGLIGLAGSESLPPSAIWWQGDCIYKNVAHVICPELLNCEANKAIDTDFIYMEAVDGLLMATQYDLEWREDVFTGWHFYDISACMEFSNAGYRIAIPRQDKPWCIHECGDKWLDENYEKWRNVFLNTYKTTN